jgi:hypothetical protein
MKRLIIFFALALVSVFSIAQVVNASANPKDQDGHDESEDRDESIDHDLIGPNDEVIHIGANGGRYYIRNGKKVYVGKKKKASSTEH